MTSDCSQVKEYLARVASASNNIGRIKCCDSSRHLYCPQCCSLLVPQSRRPPTFSLPFHVDIILDDRRGSSTGIHAKALVDALNSSGSAQSQQECNLFDLDRGDDIPKSYDTESTFVLFPVQGESVPIASVANKISRLVVLDCKWTKSSSRARPEIQKLQKVHLSSQPQETYYWRWHSAGPGMVCTIEAIYYACLEVSRLQNRSKEETDGLINLLWLFAEQRASIEKSKKKGDILPFSEAGKEKQRSLRRYEGTEKQARDREIGRALKEKARQERKEKERRNMSHLVEKVAAL